MFRSRTAARSTGMRGHVIPSLAEAVEPRLLLAIITVTTTNDSGANSLRDAILRANATPDADDIHFAIGSGVRTIGLMSALPDVTAPVTIDGASQPGYAGTPLIEVTYAGTASTWPNGLTLRASGCFVTDLSVTHLNYGILVGGGGNSIVSGCYLGLAPNGTPRGNYLSGLSIQSVNNRIGWGLFAPHGNVISGNFGAGIEIVGAPGFGVRNLIMSNRIGTDPTGRFAVPGPPSLLARVGVSIGTQINTLRDNLISGNPSANVWLHGAAANENELTGNLIGTDAAVTTALGGGGISITDGAYNNLIGGPTVGAGNVISGNDGVGIAIGERSGPGPAASVRNVVQGNFIGTNAGGTVPLPNGGAGVKVSGGSPLIGGTAPEVGGRSAAGNVIAYNHGDGVWLVAPQENSAVVGNSIHSNDGLGIDLDADGVAPSRHGLENYPTLTSATSSGGAVSVSGTLDSTASSRYRVEFFSSDRADPSGFGEGAAFLGAQEVTTDAGGLASFNVTLPYAVAPGAVVAATATPVSSLGSGTAGFSRGTSEFSRALAVTAGAPRVAQVFLNGTAWSPAFRDRLELDGAGSSRYGFSVAAAQQLDGVPWTGMNEVAIEFTADVFAKRDDLLVLGATLRYPVTSFRYDGATRTGVWSLGQSLPFGGADRVRLELNALGSGVVGAGGLRLDGEWTGNSAAIRDTFPSGDGIPGGTFEFRINVLPGDVDRNGRVNALDLSAARRRLNSSATAAAYSVFADVTADGRINALDLTSVRRNLNSVVPATVGVTAALRMRDSTPISNRPPSPD